MRPQEPGVAPHELRKTLKGQSLLRRRSVSVPGKLTQPDRVRLLLAKLTALADMNRESVKNTERRGESEADIFCCQRMVFWPV